MESESLLARIGLSAELALSLPVALRRKVTSFLLSWGAWAEAKPLIEADAKETPRGLRSRATLAKACARAGDIATAEEICEELAGEYGGQPMTLAAQGDLLVAKGEYAAAVECYRKMLACNPRSADAWSHIARACQTAGRWQAAEEYCRWALAEHLRRRSPPGGFSAREQERKHIPTHLLRLLHRQAIGANRSAEAEAIGSELDKRREEAIKRTERMVSAHLRTLAPVPNMECDGLTSLSTGSDPKSGAEPPHSKATADHSTLNIQHSTVAPTPSRRIDLLVHLKDLFGHSAFRPGQRAAVEAALAGESVLVVMPTGAGKSLCFQLPAMLQDRVALVVSPLIALMKDQVEGLPPAARRHATLVNSSLEPDEIRRRLEAIREGKFKLVYAAPERLRQRPFIHALASRGVSFFVIDEVHCLSLWGHDFRPDYLFLSTALKELGSPPIMAMTATATPEIQSEVSEHLGRRLRLISTGTFRPNLHLECIRLRTDDDKMNVLIQLCREIEGSGIVYVRSREKSERLAALLRRRDVEAWHYHAGMEPEKRSASQDRFMSGEYRVMAATVAFGMGVDKTDIRFIIHYSPPASMESYYQEVGRAGRDGLPSRCVMLYTSGDKRNLTRWLHDDQIRIENLRDCYHLIIEWVGQGKCGPINPDDLERETGLEGTKVRVAVSLLEKAGLVRRHFDLPQSSTIEVVRRAEHDDREFAQFVEAARLRPGQRLALETVDLVQRTGIPPQEIEARLLEWAEHGWIYHHSSGRAMLLEVPRPRGGERQALDKMLDLYDKAQKARVDKLFKFAESKACRHGLIARHFGEAPVKDCGACDNCKPPARKLTAPTAPIPAKEVPEKDIPLVILRAVATLPFPHGKSGLVKALKGSADSSLNKTRFRLFGALANYPKSRLGKEVNNLVTQGCLVVGGDDYFLLSLTEAGRERLK